MAWKRFSKYVWENLIWPLHAFDHRKDIAIERCLDETVLIYGCSEALKRFSERDVVKMRINGEEVSIELSKLKEKNQLDGVLKYRLTPDEGDRVFDRLQEGKNNIVFYAKDRPELMIDARIYCSSYSTGHTRSCFHGAEDIIFVKDESDGTVKSFGWFLNLRNPSLIEAEGTTDVKIRINKCDVPDFSIKLDRLRQKSWRGVPMEKLDDKENLENKQIFKHLQEGRNSITFYIEGHPESEIHARIYNWRRNSKVVIVDIDRTVTKSNIRGMWKNFTGEYYLHPGMPRLLLYLKLQGYKILYLTARPVSAIRTTRQYLADNLVEFLQEDFKKLPDGAVLTCCYGRLHSFAHYIGAAIPIKDCYTHKSFKTDVLNIIKGDKLFKKNDVLFAGFGDSKSDEQSYRNVGIERNFIVRKKGAIQIADEKSKSGDKKTKSDKIAINDFLERELSLDDRILPTMPCERIFPRIPSDDMGAYFCDNFISEVPDGSDIKFSSDFFSYHQYRLFEKGADHIFREQMEWTEFKNLDKEGRESKGEEFVQRFCTWLRESTAVPLNPDLGTEFPVPQSAQRAADSRGLPPVLLRPDSPASPTRHATVPFPRPDSPASPMNHATVPSPQPDSPSVPHETCHRAVSLPQRLCSPVFQNRTVAWVFIGSFIFILLLAFGPYIFILLWLVVGVVLRNGPPEGVSWKLVGRR